MQSCYGIKGERLWDHYQRLRALGMNPVAECGDTKLVLFLSGFRYALSYYGLRYSGSEFETQWQPRHLEDDGLKRAASIFANRLVRLARSRDAASKVGFLRDLCGKNWILNEELARLQHAFSRDAEIATPNVRSWLAKRDYEQGWILLTVAAGIIIPLSTNSKGLSLVWTMKRKPARLILAGLTTEQNNQVAEHIKGFVRDHRLDMAEPSNPNTDQFLKKLLG